MTIECSALSETSIAPARRLREQFGKGDKVNGRAEEGEGMLFYGCDMAIELLTARMTWVNQPSITITVL